jgi:Spy/CpxP family protein refolding chaperone
MRGFWTWVLILAVPTGWVAAQQSEDLVPEGAVVQLLLLRQKSVQTELKLGPDFARKVSEFTNKEADAYGDALKLQDAERKNKIDELRRANQKFIEENLSDAQRKRLDQITLQVTGLQQLNRPEVAKRLNLTEEQQTKFSAMRKAARKSLEAIFAAGGEGKNEKLAELRAEIDKKIGAVLTDEQKAKVREAVGEPFRGELVFEEFTPATKK